MPRKEPTRKPEKATLQPDVSNANTQEPPSEITQPVVVPPLSLSAPPPIALPLKETAFVTSPPEVPPMVPPIVENRFTEPISKPIIPTNENFLEEEDEDMRDVKWEYCRMVLDSGRYPQQQNLGRYPYFVRVTIEYYGTADPINRKFSEDTDEMEGPERTWGRLLGLLGAAGWELINFNLGRAKDQGLFEAMAYFKRPVQEGRKVDEPLVSPPPKQEKRAPYY
jgi:hypothetical protein